MTNAPSVEEKAAHLERLTGVIDNLLEATGELNRIFRLDNGVYVAPPRIQLVAVFTVIDVLSNYWYEYLGDGKANTPKLRFEAFLEKFGYVEENNAYKNRKYLGQMEISSLYSLRNALVHFYGLGGENRCVLPNPSELLSEKQIEATHRSVSLIAEKRGEVGQFVQPLELKEVTIAATKLLLKFFEQQEILKVPERNSYVASIQRIYEKIDRDGGFPLTKEDAEILSKKLSDNSG